MGCLSLMVVSFGKFIFFDLYFFVSNITLLINLLEFGNLAQIVSIPQGVTKTSSCDNPYGGTGFSGILHCSKQNGQKASIQ